MDITLEKVGKRYRLEWILKGIDYTFKSGEKYALAGPNGSGKSTFLKLLSGHLSPSKGRITFLESGKALDRDQIFQRVSLAAPYIELVEEFSIIEQLHFHNQFRMFIQGLRTQDLLEISGLAHAANKPIRYFSSGMKQRLKLLIAITSDSSLLLLDEPSTNLDRPGVEWFQDLLGKYLGKRTLVIASNVDEDFQHCDKHIQITDFKS